MAKIFIGIALALMLATAALSFLAKGNIDKLQSSLKETKSSRDTAERKAKEESQKAKTAEEERDAATTKAEEATKELTAKKQEADTLTTQINEQKMMVETKTKEVADLTEKLAAAGKPDANGVVMEDPRIAELTRQLQEAQASAAEAKQVSQSLGDQIKDVQSKLSAAEQKEKLRASGMVRAGLQGRILAVNSGWNFVVLSVGDKQGVIVNSPLLVVRNNQPIARLRITSVEPSTSIADIIPGTVGRGVSVQPGDTVIFEGRSTATENMNAAGNAPALPN